MDFNDTMEIFKLANATYLVYVHMHMDIFKNRDFFKFVSKNISVLKFHQDDEGYP